MLCFCDVVIQVSNEIIHRCCAKISIPDAFDGDVLAVVEAVNASIDCCIAWKDAYQHTASMTRDYPSPRNHVWNLDEVSAIWEVMAFCSRCLSALRRRAVVARCLCLWAFLRVFALGWRVAPPCDRTDDPIALWRVVCRAPSLRKWRRS